MKDLIRMNQLAGLITEGQARKMMAILNEESKGWLGTGIDEETLKTFIVLYHDDNEQDSLGTQGMMSSPPPTTDDGKDVLDMVKDHPGILKVSYDYCAKGQRPDKNVQNACAQTILRKRKLRGSNLSAEYKKANF